MPKIAMDYSRTQFYKIVCKDLTIIEIYVGHSTNWTKRKNKHKYSCNNENSKEYNYPVYQFIRNNGGWDNWDMILIEDYSCENKLQATQRERYWIETLNATLNCNIPSRTYQEYYETNKDKILQQTKQYIQENKDQILQQRKQYREENVELISQRKSIYYEKNKERIIQKRNEKITCECGSSVIRANLGRHQQSKKHQDYMEQKEG